MAYIRRSRKEAGKKKGQKLKDLAWDRAKGLGRKGKLKARQLKTAGRPEAEKARIAAEKAKAKKQGGSRKYYNNTYEEGK